MMNSAIEKLIKKYKDLLLYIFFGGCITVVNVASYYVSYILSLIHI